jgi:ABC-type dipeptide/oligopeptide/nickel transport system ATPase component
MKIIGLIGEPAAGKSTVMKNFIATLGEGEIVKDGLVVYTRYNDDRVIIAGKYEEGVTFCGTDTLSKGCGPKYREWLEKVHRDPAFENWTFYWEGERFSNNPFMELLTNLGATTYYLEADGKTLNERNANRSNQNLTWRKGMQTRMHNLRDKYPVEIVQQGFKL